MAHTIMRDRATGRVVEGTGVDNEVTQGSKYRRSEFVLAMSIFVAMSVIGTAFGLWMVGTYNAKPAGAPPTVEGKAPVPQVPPVEAARPDPVAPADGAIDKK